jgi:hypothetical protein
MMSDPDQREYFRIDDLLAIDFKHVDDEEFERLRNIIRYNPAYTTDKACEMHFLGEVMSQRKSEETELYTYLRVLEKKLDMILLLLGQQDKSLAYKSLTTRVNISGAGMKFVSDEPLGKGERLELRLGLPIAPFPKISTLCQVVRVEEPSDAAAREWRIALKFLVMNDYDRDVMINYIFSKEREKLRSEKETG